tara:strand:- start:1408 stop:1521 length:114 start_codon:yes stop_codon:yes gene_type:complete
MAAKFNLVRMMDLKRINISETYPNQYSSTWTDPWDEV